MKYLLTPLLVLLPHLGAAEPLKLNDQEYFTMPGLDVTVFADVYPEGHQSGQKAIKAG